MKNENYKKSAQITIDLQIVALKKLKKSIGKAFHSAVKTIGECNSKTILIKKLALKNEDNLLEIDHLTLNRDYNLSNFKNIKIKTKENEEALKLHNDGKAKQRQGV